MAGLSLCKNHLPLLGIPSQAFLGEHDTGFPLLQTVLVSLATFLLGTGFTMPHSWE